jgi:cell volume regulation protein A
VVVRPVVGLPLLLAARLERGETAFVLLAGLKGAVPLLLGSMMLPLSGGDRLYGVVVVVVLVSVIGQGTLVPAVARWLHVGMRPVEPAPFSAGLRLSQDPAGQRRLTVAAGSAAEGTRIDALPGLAEGTWVAMLARDGGLVRVLAGTQLRAGDQVLLLVGPLQDNAALEAVFTDPGMTTADR